MRTFNLTLVAGGALIVASLMAAPPAMAADPEPRVRIQFRSPDQALDQGIGAYKAGMPDLAIQALESAIESTARSRTDRDARVRFISSFYLARILSDNSHALTDHGRAYDIYFRIVDLFSDIDPEVDPRAPFVAKALLALAHYTRNGVPGREFRPNPHRSAHFVHQAATVFSDEEAQFELAKLFLTGDGIDPDVRRAIHWFSVLTQRGHWGAQAYLAEIYWRGQHVEPNQRRAMALITLALEAAPASERIWMEDIHQDIYCGTTEGTRSEARGVVADWRQKFGRAAEPRTAAVAGLAPNAPRACSDGRRVPVVIRQQKDASLDLPAGAGQSLVPSTGLRDVKGGEK